jgi:hypothetical protein
MFFAFDAEKSKINFDKHGIDFTAVQAMWDDPGCIEIAAKTVDEPRFMVIGKIAEKHWSAIITYRGDAIRIISARRSRKEEKRFYESQRSG